MKKLILIFLILPVTVFAQAKFDVSYTEVKDGAKLLQGKFAEVANSCVIEKDGTAAELYSSIIGWINEAYKSPEDVIKGITENKYIKINGFTSGLIPSTVLGMSSYYDARYTIEFRFKDNKFKVDIIDFETYTPPSQYVAGGWMDRVMKFKVETRKGKPYKDGVANLARFTEHFDNLIKDATEYNNSTEDSKDFDF